MANIRYFQRTRPPYVVPLTRDDRLLCCCIYDENTRKMLEALDTYIRKCKSRGLAFRHQLKGDSPSDAIKIITCCQEDADFTSTKQECLQGCCAACGSCKLWQYLEVTGSKLPSDILPKVQYEQFENVAEPIPTLPGDQQPSQALTMVPSDVGPDQVASDSEDDTADPQPSSAGSGGDGQSTTVRVKKRLTVVKHEAPLREYMQKLELSVSRYARHYFNSQWQRKVFKNMHHMLRKDGHIAIGMDFSENYQCKRANATKHTDSICGILNGTVPT